MIAQIALRIPHSSPFNYLIPKQFLDKKIIGSRVLVPLKNRLTIGVVVNTINQNESNQKLKSIIEFIDEEPVFNSSLLQITQWIAEYYLCSWGEVLDTALPSGLNIKLEKRIKINREHSIWLKLSNEEQKWLTKIENKIAENVKKYKTFPLYQDLYNNLQKQKLIELNIVPKYKENAGKNALINFEYPQEEYFKLNKEQKDVFQKISQRIQQQKFQTFLIHGITGSGKTEIYLYLARESLNQQKSILVLLPEIALTPQIVGRFRSRFGDHVAVLHSKMREKDRLQQWWKIKTNSYSIVIGTRSAIFAPIENLGLIIVDEEHDSSFKQNETPHYQARDTAVQLGQFHQIVVVLGSATPSIESYRNTQLKKYQLLTLDKRANAAKLPSTQIINLKKESRYPGIFYLSRILLQSLKDNYSQQKQSIIFLNRRGYAAYLTCPECTTPILCQKCSIAMTWHKKKHRLICHYCDYTQPPPSKCPICQHNPLQEEGFGTERVEHDLKRLFPQARFLRFDRDNITSQEDLEKSILAIREHQVDFIIGTQLICKGHDFKNVTLVAVLLADASLGIPDFRSSEKTFQLLSQVSGRGGRSKEAEGVTVIQTYNPDHYAIQAAACHDYSSFFLKEIENRILFNNPPITRSIILRIRGIHELKTKEITNIFYAQLQKQLKSWTSKEKDYFIDTLGPIEAPIYKINNQYHWQIVLKFYYGKILRRFVKNYLINFIKKYNTNDIHIIIDVDPD